MPDPTSPTARILDGSSWHAFLDTLRAAGDVILREGSPTTAFDRAEGFRYLSRLVRVALESHLECADPAFPVFRRPSHETVKIGADNPDNYYQSAAVRGDLAYRIRGIRNTVHYLGLGTYAGRYGSDARRGQTGYLEGSDLEMDGEGRFEIVVSREPHPGNWLPMEADTTSLIVRQTFQDRARETVADLSIERIGGEKTPRPITPEVVDEGLASAASYVLGTASLFAEWSERFALRPNELPLLDPAIAAEAHGDPNIRYYHGYWEIEPDEALLVEVTPPTCEYWNFQLNNYWMESLDYRYHTIAVNHHGARLEDDGSVRIVIADRDPGVGNWIDTAGHRRGTMCLRWVRADSHPEPRTHVVPLPSVP